MMCVGESWIGNRLMMMVHVDKDKDKNNDGACG